MALMNANFLKRHEKDSETIVKTAIAELSKHKLVRIAEILGLNSGTVHNWITGKAALSTDRAREILLLLRSAPNVPGSLNICKNTPPRKKF